MAKVTTVPSYKIEEHMSVNHNHHMVRCAHNRSHWWYFDDHCHPSVKDREMTVDDFGNLVPIN